MENKCNNCESKISKSDLFCPNCGLPLKDKESNINSKTLEEQQPPITTNAKQNKRITKRVVATILAVILIICVGVSISYNIEKYRNYTITLDSKNGNSTYDYIVTNKTSVELPTPTKDDCYFDGWYTADGIIAEKAIANNAKAKKNLMFYGILIREWRSL